MPKRTARQKPRRAPADPGRSSRKARQAAAQRKRRWTRAAAISAVAGVATIVTVMVVLALTRSPETMHTAAGAGLAGDLAQHVPVSVLDAVGAGRGITPPKPLPSGTPPLERDGKVEV